MGVFVLVLASIHKNGIILVDLSQTRNSSVDCYSIWLREGMSRQAQPYLLLCSCRVH